MTTLYNETNRATYCPEDNKLRLYVGRVPRPEYDALRAEGWTALYKQREAGQGDFAATWSPARKRTALAYAGLIEDEDAGPDERAADRAERFGGYLEKRTGEAEQHADQYDSGPGVHGYQSAARAERAAARHDRAGDKAVDAWERAEYWQRRTAGVISHALYVSSPAVRMGRIKTLEAEQRKQAASLAQYAALYSDFETLRAIEDHAEQTAAVVRYVGSRHIWAEYQHPDEPESSKTSLYCLATSERRRKLSGAEIVALFFSDHSAPTIETEWSRHYALRLAYENQMIEAQGGRAAFVEMEVGGWLGKHQVRKVNKSPVTGRVVSVTLRIEGNRWGNAAKPGEYYERAFNIERLPFDAYTPPTAEDKAAFADKRKAEKAAAPKKESCPIINPTDADAEQLQAIWNAASEGKRWDKETPAVPQKPLPPAVFSSPRAAQLAIVQDRIAELQTVCGLLSGSMKNTGDLLTDEQRELFRLAQLVGYAYNSSLSQRGLTDKARDFMRSRVEVAA